MTTKAALIKAREWLDASDRSARTILDGGQCTEEFRKLFTGNLAVYETIRDLLDKAIGGEYVMVPREPTDAMAEAENSVCPANFETRYKAMIAASGER